MQHQDNPFYEQLVTFITLVLSAVLTIVTQRLTKVVSKMKGRPADLTRKIERSTPKNSEIQRLLLEVLQILPDAQRAYVSMYHNGDHFIDDCEVLKKTRTHEVTRPGIAYQAEMFKGILISLIPDETQLVMEPGPSWKLVNELPDGKFKWRMRESGTDSVARCALWKIIEGERVMIGSLDVDFDSVVKPPNILEVCQYASMIEELL